MRLRNWEPPSPAWTINQYLGIYHVDSLWNPRGFFCAVQEANKKAGHLSDDLPFYLFTDGISLSA